VGIPPESSFWLPQAASSAMLKVAAASAVNEREWWCTGTSLYTVGLELVLPV
jgi:hypothetical protein